MSERRDDTYLWTGRGTPDSRVEELEHALAPLRHVARDFAAESVPPSSRRAARRRWARGSLWAAAASLALATVAAMTYWRFHWPVNAAWPVEVLAGSPRVAGTPLVDRGRLEVGAELETAAGERALLVVARIGRVEVLPETRLRLVATGGGRHRLALERGEIAARLWAPPHAFAISTAGSAVYDLGCAFTLAVQDSGDGLLRVSSGWVELEEGRRETLVPEGAAARLYRSGPGSPFVADARADFLRALDAVDAARLGGRELPASALAELLATARPSDALTLVHLVSRVSVPARGEVFDRLVVLLPPPPEVTRAAILAGDPVAFDLWWHRLGLSPVKRWWIHWRDLTAGML